MTERQLRRIINEEINNILNEAPQYAVPEEFEGIIANDPKILLRRKLYLSEKHNGEEVHPKGIENSYNIKYALVVFFKDPLTNKSVSEEPLNKARDTPWGISGQVTRPWGIGVALSDNATELMQIANKISKQRGRLGSQLTRDLICLNVNTSKYVADICAIYDAEFEMSHAADLIHLNSLFGTVTMEQEIQTQMFR